MATPPSAIGVALERLLVDVVSAMGGAALIDRLLDQLVDQMRRVILGNDGA